MWLQLTAASSKLLRLVIMLHTGPLPLIKRAAGFLWRVGNRGAFGHGNSMTGEVRKSPVGIPSLVELHSLRVQQCTDDTSMFAATTICLVYAVSILAKICFVHASNCLQQVNCLAALVARLMHYYDLFRL